VTKEDAKVGCELFEGGEGVFSMDPKLCVGMPASHHKYKVQNVRVVGLFQDAIEDRKDALWGVALGDWNKL